MEQIIQTLSPAIDSRMLTEEQRNAFDQGLDILEMNKIALPFVRDSHRFKDYHRRVRKLLTLLQTSSFDGVSTPSHKQSRHVGRPTKAEKEAYTAQQKKKALEEAKASLFPTVTPDTNLQPLTYNGIVANPNGESIAATMPNLRDLRPFLSPALQERVNTVRDLRNEMASKAEQAKTMAEANEKSVQNGSPVLYKDAEISILTERVVDIESHILPDIYIAVDREMGEVYLRLSAKNGDPEYIKHIETTCNITPQDLRTRFKPFYEKALARDPRFATAIAEKIANDRPEVKAARDAAAKHKAEADALIKYIIRKDKPSTKARVKGLTERIAKLRKDYSDIVAEEEIKGYEAILNKVIEESNSRTIEQESTNK